MLTRGINVATMDVHGRYADGCSRNRRWLSSVNEARSCANSPALLDRPLRRKETTVKKKIEEKRPPVNARGELRLVLDLYSDALELAEQIAAKMRVSPGTAILWALGYGLAGEAVMY